MRETDPDTAAPRLPPLDTRAVEEGLQAFIGEDVVGGLIRVVSDGDRWTTTAGSAELGGHRPVDPEGSFRIGSLTKVLVATVILQLVDEGRIVLDEPLQHQVPGLLPPDQPPVTVRQLLVHSSGIPNYLPLITANPHWNGSDRFRSWAPEELVAIALDQPRTFAPGSRLGYSNTNYVLLGLLIREVTGRPWGEEIARRITGPLAMASTSDPGDDPVLPFPCARGYAPTDRGLLGVTSIGTSVLDAAGSMISTARDLELFVAALLAGDLVPPPLVDEMLRPLPEPIEGMPPVVAWGLGTTIIRLPDGCGVPAVYGGAGGLPGYNTLAFGTRDGRRRMVLSLNLGAADELQLVPQLIDITRTVFCGRP
jgi:D-alanyl-D-alanine carboxypeptidase